MAAYTARRGRYQVNEADCRYPCGGGRPTKLAAGMTYTAARKGTRQSLEGDALTLAVRGTLDPLAFTNRMKRYRHAHFKLVTVQRWERAS